jgi:[methyl-Co(III) methanol-specific corrinoid protein]:coenzyme M methyltransferase
MNEKERFLAALRREPLDRVPCACPLQTGTVPLMQGCGVYWPEANHDGRKMAVLSRAAHDIGMLESVRVPFDVAVDASAFGAVLGNEAIDRQPAVMAPRFRQLEDLDGVEVPDPRRDGRAPAVLQAVEVLSRQLPDTPVICGVVMPFNLATLLRGTEAALMDLILDATKMRELLRLASEWNLAFIEAAIRAGADAITMVDSAASGDLISPQQFAEHVLPYDRMAADLVRTEGAASVIHICGRITHHMDDILEIGADGVSVEQNVDLHWAKRKTLGRAALIGNVSPTTTLLWGGPNEVRREAKSCIEAGVDVLSPGCGYAPWTPLVNMRAMRLTNELLDLSIAKRR